MGSGVRTVRVPCCSTLFRSSIFSIYYQRDSSRLSTCPVTVHALLHIAPSIRATGPVWVAWNFPTERQCGEMQRSIKSRRHPYISLNNYVTAAAHLNQIKLLYNLHTELALKPPITTDKFAVETCRYFEHFPGMTLTYPPTDPSFVLMSPRIDSVLPLELWKKLTATLSTRFKVSVSAVRKNIPKEISFVQYGRVQCLDGGDNMQGRGLVRLGPDNRDSSYVRVSISSLVDIKAALTYFNLVSALCRQVCPPPQG